MSNYVIPSSGSMPSLDVIYSYADIGRYGNQRMVISSGALRELQAMTSFTQLRWQCRKSSVGRTIDVMTSKNALGYATVNYFKSTYSPRPDICGSYYSGPDDTSLTSQRKCSDWCYIGKWSHSGWEDKYYKVYDHPFYVAYNYHFIIRPGPRLECDDYNGGVSPGDFWKIYVR